MANLSQFSLPTTPATTLMFDGSELFPYLWQYFLNHEHLRAWLMRADPYNTAVVSPKQAAQGIAFCCNFTVPEEWGDMSSSFDLGEMFVPDHAYSHFMCGTVVASTSYHKHLVCALGPAAKRHPKCLPSYQTQVRRMIIDMGSSHSINIIEFSWMQDGALIVTAKILVPPNKMVPYQSAGCTGAFALFQGVLPAGDLPTVPKSLVSFVEVPRCSLCTARGSLGCYCNDTVTARGNRQVDEYSSAVWPPRIVNDVMGVAVDSYHNIRSRLDSIQHIAHVKITAHTVSTQELIGTDGYAKRTYKLGPSRFVVRAVLFRPANSFESDTLRQVADKLRLLRMGNMRVTHSLRKMNKVTEQMDEDGKAVVKTEILTLNLASAEEGFYEGQRKVKRTSYSAFPQEMKYTHFPSVHNAESSHETVSCSSCSRKGNDPNGMCSHIQDNGTASVTNRSGGPKKCATASIQDVASRVTETPSSAPFVPSRRLICPACGKTFSQQGSLNRHLKNIHEEKKIPCEYCNMSFGQMFDLKRHQQRKHVEKYTPITRRGSSDLRKYRAKTTSPVD